MLCLHKWINEAYLDGKMLPLESFIDEVNRYLIWYCNKRIKRSLESLSPIEYRRKLRYTVSTSLYIKIYQTMYGELWDLAKKMFVSPWY